MKEKEITAEELLQELGDIHQILKHSLPKEAPALISSAIDPSKALYLREACLHRIAELTESAFEAFTKKNYVTAYLLSRGIVEVVAL